MIAFIGAFILAGPAVEPEFTVRTVDGRDLIGPVRKLTPDGSLRLGGEKATVLKADEVMGLRRRGVFAPSVPLADALFLSNGDCISLEAKAMVRLQDEQLHCLPAAPLRPEKGHELAVPFAALACLWMAVPSGVDEPEKFRRRFLDERRTRDVLLLRNGDRVEGVLTGLDTRKGCTLKTRLGPVTVPWPQLAILGFNSDFQSRRLPRQAYSHVVLQNGGRLSLLGTELEHGPSQLTGKMLLGPAFRFPLEELVTLDMRQHRGVYLSDQKPKSYVHTPFLGIAWPLATDSAVSGRAMRLGGNVFDKGLGMHAASRVTYLLEGKYEYFEAIVGLDDATGKRGRVGLEVLVDGKAQTLPLDRELTGDHAPAALRIDVRGAQEMTLAVNFAGNAGVQAQVNWAEARLIK